MSVVTTGTPDPGERACPICEQPLPDNDNAVNEHYDTAHNPASTYADRMRDIGYALQRQAIIPGYYPALFEWWNADFERWYITERYRVHLRTCRRCRRKWLLRQWIPVSIEGVLPDAVKRLIV